LRGPKRSKIEVVAPEEEEEKIRTNIVPLHFNSLYVF